MLNETGGLLSDYYLKDFIPGLENGTRRSYEVERFLPTTPETVYLQHLYIAANPSPLGQKVELVDPGTQANTVKYTRNITRFWKAIGKNLSFMTFS